MSKNKVVKYINIKKYQLYMNKNKFNYFVIFCLFFFLGIVIYRNFLTSQINHFSSLDYFFINLYPSLNVIFIKAVNIIFFILFVALISKLLKEKWSIFLLVLILNPFVYFIITSVNLLFFFLFLLVFALYLLKTKKNFTLLVLSLLLIIFNFNLFIYILLVMSIYLLNKKVEFRKNRFLNEENKELILTLLSLAIMYFISQNSVLLNFNIKSDPNLVLTTVVYSLVYVIFSLTGIFQLNKAKKINLFQIILLFILAYYFRNELFIVLIINVVLAYLVTIYLFSFIFKKWKYLGLKTVTLLLLALLFVANSFVVDLQKEVETEYDFDCDFDDYILTDIYNYEYVKAHTNNCDIKVYNQDFTLNQKIYMDKLDDINFNKYRNINSEQISNNLTENISDIESDSNMEISILNNNEVHEKILNFEIVDIISQFFNSNNSDFERLNRNVAITIYEELFYELDIIEFLNKAIINEVKYIVLSKDSTSEIWDYNFGLISYYKRFKYIEDSNSIILKIYS